MNAAYLVSQAGTFLAQSPPPVSDVGSSGSSMLPLVQSLYALIFVCALLLIVAAVITILGWVRTLRWEKEVLRRLDALEPRS